MTHPVRSVRELFQFTSQYQSQIKFECYVGDSQDNFKYKYTCPHGENTAVGEKVEANTESSCVVRNIE